MTTEKFTSETETLKKFFEIFCKGKKHENIKNQKFNATYNNEEFNFEFELCDECFDLLKYSINRLEGCPHDPKPRCRTCPSPCYEKDKWKKVAKLMRYSGMKLGILKIKKLFGRK